MKTLSLLVSIILLSGCATTTRIRVSDGAKSVDILLPKNLTADRLDADIEPQTGILRLRTVNLRADASGVIRSTGNASKAAIGGAIEGAATILPLVK